MLLCCYVTHAEFPCVGDHAGIFPPSSDAPVSGASLVWFTIGRSGLLAQAGEEGRVLRMSAWERHGDIHNDQSCLCDRAFGWARKRPCNFPSSSDAVCASLVCVAIGRSSPAQVCEEDQVVTPYAGRQPGQIQVPRRQWSVAHDQSCPHDRELGGAENWSGRRGAAVRCHRLSHAFQPFLRVPRGPDARPAWM